MRERIVSEVEIRAVSRLSGPKRYDHFIKHVVDCEQAWGLWDDGWAMGADDEGRPTFQLWPARAYAALCAVDLWAGYEPSSISLSDLLDELLPKLRIDGVTPGVFRTAEGQSVMPDIDVLVADLRHEMSRY